MMLRRDDFVWCVGYQGDAAVVDTRAKKTYGKLSSKQLLEKGLFRPACSAAIYDNSDADMQQVIDAYNAATGAKLSSAEEMKRLLGISAVPDDISTVIRV